MCIQRIYAGMALVVGLAGVPFSASAQDIQAQLLPPIDLKPVTFNEEVKESIGTFSNVANTVFKPPGEGPFPAAVLMHTCGGLKGAPNAHMKQHAQELLEAGHVVLVVDSFGPRGIDNCAARLISQSAGIADAYAALAFLAAKPFVNKSRIYQVGYSWGAMVSTLLASPQSARMAGSSLRFAATVSHYSSCVYKSSSLVLQDIDRPLLMLMGGRDQDLPAAPCFPLLDELRTAGKSVQWHVYPEATHAWDKPSLQGKGYVYSPQTTADATARMLRFLTELK